MSTEQGKDPKVNIRRVTVMNNVLAVVVAGLLIAVGILTNKFYQKHSEEESPLVLTFNLKRSPVPEADKESIQTLIQDAINIEFNSYKSAENPDSTVLLDYFIANGPAYNKIWESVSDVKRRGWSLLSPTNASYAVLLEVEVVNVSEDGKTAEAVTRENWYLDYVLVGTEKSIYTYSQLNSQYYQLKNTADGWRIYLNHYPTTNVILDK